MLIRFLKQPFPYFPKKWHVVVLMTLCVFPVSAIFLLYIKPIDFRTIAQFVGGFALIAFTCSSIMFYLFPILFKRFFDEKRWTIGKFFLFAFLLCLMICVSDTLYDNFIISKMYQAESNFFNSLFNNTLIVFSIGTINTIVGYFWLKSLDLHSDLKDKEDQCQKLLIRTQQHSISNEKIITLSGNTKESLTLFPRELLYIVSLSNYVHIYYKMDEQILQKLLRTTLQQMEELLSEYPYLVRCHRSYIVNTNQIKKIKGMQLWLKSIETKIPISKNYKPIL